MSAPPRRRRPPFTMAGGKVLAGHRAQFELPIARLMSGTPVGLPVIVVHGSQEGPTIWVSSAVHGDEICGVEIIRRVLGEVRPQGLSGTLLAVPVVNVTGFNTGDRYLPDRRDLNRSFPGSERGSLAARIAHLMMTEIIGRAEVGIDLHTGSGDRTNLPQVRGDLDDGRTLALALAFGAPIAIHSKVRDGSLRQAATEAGSVVLLYEGGEAGRFDEAAIAAGAAGIRRTMASLGMLVIGAPPPVEPAIARHTRWTRATRSGILHLHAGLGARVVAGDPIATVFDPFGRRVGRVSARASGLIIGVTQNPLVHRGDAVAHIAELEEG